MLEAQKNCDMSLKDITSHQQLCRVVTPTPDQRGRDVPRAQPGEETKTTISWPMVRHEIAHFILYAFCLVGFWGLTIYCAPSYES